MKERISDVPLNNAASTAGGTKPFLPNLSDEELRKLAREKLSEALQTVDATINRDLAVRLSNAIVAQSKAREIDAIIGLSSEAELRQHSADVNIDLLVRKLEAARKLAMKNDEPAAATAAIMSMAKLHGLLVDKREMSLKRPEDMTEAEIMQVLGITHIEELEGLTIEHMPAAEETIN